MPDKVVEMITCRRPSLIGEFKRDRKTGCLLYIGRPRGPSIGNPLLADKKGGRHTTHHLRSLVWALYYGRVPKSQYVVMSCGIFNCHEPSHMKLSRKKGRYRTKYVQYRAQLPDKVIRDIRYFNGKVTVSVLCRVFVPSSYLIRRIHSGLLRPDIQVPRNYRPGKEVLYRISLATMNSQRRFLAPVHTREAVKAIRRSGLSEFEKVILLDRVRGKSAVEIAKKHGLLRDRVNLTIRHALSILKTEENNPEWTRLLTHPKHPHGS